MLKMVVCSIAMVFCLYWLRAFGLWIFSQSFFVGMALCVGVVASNLLIALAIDRSRAGRP
jgi:hypothetical protein